MHGNYAIKTILFYLFFLNLFTFIYGQSQTKLRQSFYIDESSTLLSLNDSSNLSYNDVYLFNNDTSIYKVKAGEILKVLTGLNPEHIIVVSVNFPKSKNSAILTFQSIIRFKIIGPFWQVEIPYDTGIPKIILHQDQIFILHSETQSYSIYSLNGKLIGHYKLFDNSQRNLEKVILSTYNNNQLFFLGMKSEFLNSKNNITLFQLGQSLEPEPIVIFDMVQPYFTSVSRNNIIGVVGTKNPTESINPTAYLNIYDLNNFNIILATPLNQMPRQITWVNNRLALIYNNQITVYNPLKVMNPITFYFDGYVYPLDYEKNGNSLLILSAKTISPKRNGISYEKITLIHCDLLNGIISSENISNDSFNNVNLSFFNNAESFFIQLDNTVHQYKMNH